MKAEPCSSGEPYLDVDPQELADFENKIKSLLSALIDIDGDIDKKTTDKGYSDKYQSLTQAWWDVAILLGYDKS